jgi:hypothetical protein
VTLLQTTLPSSEAFSALPQHGHDEGTLRRVSQSPGMFSSSCAVLATSADRLRGSAESYGHTTTINTLQDDLFLDIFQFVVSEWQILVHVCQRWRRVVFASPRGLDLTILCTYGTPVKKNLSYWPPFPIVVDYFTWSGMGLPPNYEDDVTAALEHPDRVRSIKLSVTSSLFGIVASVMQEPFLALKSLWLSSQDRNPLVLPDLFLNGSATHLQQIHLVGISFPALPTILPSASNLVDLQLKEIPQDGYISPESMVTSLAALTRLDTLCIWFRSPTSHPHIQLISSSSSTRDVFPSLITLKFRGCSEYLEHLLARIDAPRLHCLETTFFNQLDFRVPQLSQFISRTGSLDLPHSRLAKVRIRISNLDIKLDFEAEEHSRSRLTLCISCKWLDWQVSLLAQILGQTPSMVSNVDDLSIDEVDLQLDPGWKDDTDWLELLLPFTAVTMLRGSKQFAGRIALALDGVGGEKANEVLPALVLLSLEDQPMSSAEQFVTARQLSGYPIMLLDTEDAESIDLVDGFIARTFAFEGATNYLVLLLKTQRFFQHYRIVCHQGAWYITRNSNLVQGASPGVPHQPTPLLDYCTSATHGTVVPQRRWMPADDVDIRRYIESAVLQLPIFFVNRNGGLGFLLPDILRGYDHDLNNANSFAPLGGSITTHVRIHVSLSLGYYILW